MRIPGRNAECNKKKSNYITNVQQNITQKGWAEMNCQGNE